MVSSRYSLLTVTLLGLLAIRCVNAEIVTSPLVREPVIVIASQTVVSEVAEQIITLPDGASVLGHELTLACLSGANAVDDVLVYLPRSRGCFGLTGYNPQTASPQLNLTFMTLDTGPTDLTALLGQAAFVLVIPPGEAGIAGLGEEIFSDGFE